MNFIQKHRRPLTATFAAIVLAATVALMPQVVRATVGEFVASALANLGYFFIQLFVNLLVVVINIMVAVAQYNDFLAAPAVVKGWVIVRDLANMFFIVVLLIIAFGTILKLENYRYNRLLARLIVMAILVNFSKFIAGFFIDFAQVVMLTFVNAWRDVAAGNITTSLGLAQIVDIVKSGDSINVEANEGAVLGAVALGLFLVVVATIVMAIIAIVLLLRILALWFLIVLSPLAYLLRTYPSTEKYAARWWSEFGKYTVTGPVVAFLLWLSLAIMAQSGNQLSDQVLQNRRINTTEGGQIIRDGIGSTDPRAQQISAAITEIGKSERLLSYITGIMLLVGTLVITKELGVAGGQLAGRAAESIRGFATKAATFAGAGAVAAGTVGAGWTVAGGAGYLARKPLAKVGGIAGRGIGNNIIDRAQVALGGIPLRPSAWIEGFKRGGDRRRHDAEDRRVQAAQKQMERYEADTTGKKMSGVRRAWQFARAAAGSPEYLRYNVLTGDLFKKPRQVLGVDYAEQRQRLAAMSDTLKEQKARNKLQRAALNPGAYYLDQESTKQVEGEIQARMATVDITTPRYGKELAAELTNRGIDVKSTSPVDVAERTRVTSEFEQSWRRRQAKEQMEKEIKERALRERIDTVKADRASDPESLYNQRVVTSDKNKKTTEKYADLLAAKLKDIADPAKRAEAEKKFEDDWNQDIAERELKGQTQYVDPLEYHRQQKIEALKAGTSDEDLRTKGRQAILAQSQELDEEAGLLRGGKNTKAFVDQKNKQLQDIEKTLQQIEKDLVRHPEGSEQRVALEQQLEDQKRLRELIHRLLDPSKLTEADKQTPEYLAGRKMADNDADDKQAEAKRLRDRLNARVTKSDIDLLEEQIQNQEQAVQAQEREVRAVRPAVPQELRKQLRAAIAEKKKEITTESWEEQLSVLEDALRKDDLALAAAALQRSSEEGNLNEIMSSFGYKSDATGLKDFIKDKFIKELHASQDQALSIANDASYAAEKANHWTFARGVKTNTVTGQLEWQSERDRQKEALAEIRKLDFETTIRRFNRLGWGTEVIGHGTEMENATPEEKAAYYRRTGDRKFVMSPYGVEFFTENFGKMMRNINTGRFNVNLAIEMQNPANQVVIQRLEKEARGKVQPGEGGAATTIDVALDGIREYAQQDKKVEEKYGIVEQMFDEMDRS